MTSERSQVSADKVNSARLHALLGTKHNYSYIESSFSFFSFLQSGFLLLLTTVFFLKPIIISLSVMQLTDMLYFPFLS